MSSESSAGSKSRQDLYIFTLLFLLALAVRLPRLGALDVWFDEVALLFQTKMSYAQIWAFCKEENFPPLYAWLLKIWSLIGSGENWLRVLSLWLGALIPPVAYLLSKQLHDRKLGLLLGVACILSLPLFFYAQIIRMYSLWVLMVCLSYLGFLKALKTNEWKYWILMSAANLVGFYTFLFTLFIIVAEVVILIWHYRLQRKRYWRLFLTHLPAILLMGLWVSTLLTRYHKVSEYVSWRLDWFAVFNVWIYLGTNTTFGDRYIPVILLNLPFLIGFILGVPRWSQRSEVMHAGAIFLLGGGLVALLSTIGHSMFFGRYLLFLLPLYLALTIYGWLTLPRKFWRYAGLSSVFLPLILAFLYHNVNYVASNDYSRYVGQFASARGDDGRSLSRSAQLLKARLSPSEVIIHHTSGHVRLRCFSFFPMIYYHQQSLPEFIYSEDPVPLYCGGQYLKPADRVKSLQDFESPPAGIWLVTWDQPVLVDYTSPQSQRLHRKHGTIPEDLPKELYDAGYRIHEKITDYSVTLVHFLKNDKTSG